MSAEGLRRLQEQAAGTGKDHALSATEAEELAAELATTILPHPPCLIADDCTPEKIPSLLSQNGGRIAVMSPEGDIFNVMAGRYSANRAPNFVVLLKGHAGDAIRVDRVGRSPDHVNEPAITIGLTLQPEVIRGLASKPGFRGEGLLARFLYSLPVSLMGRRMIDPPAMPEEVRRDYRTLILALLNLTPGNDADREPAPHVLRLTPEARNMLTEFERVIEPQLAEFGSLGSFSDWGGKLPGAVARIAALLHMAELILFDEALKTPLSMATMTAAIRIGRYLIRHASAAFAEMGADPVVGRAKKILRWLEHSKLPAFTRRDAHQAMRSTFRRAEDLDAPLLVLMERGFLRRQPCKAAGPGRKPSPEFDVNPLWVRCPDCAPGAGWGNSEYFEYSELPSAETGRATPLN